MNKSSGRVVRASERGHAELRYGRGVVEQIVGPEVGAGRLDLHLNRILAGSAPGPYHLHPNAENVYLVVTGSLLVRIARESHLLGPGDAAFVPAGMAHSASNAGEVDVEVIEVYAPANPDFVEIEE